ncbi:hypothetical protein TNCV_779021 [Trichonephila clavipes]|nr:hypothetical protein TNCV_779021 [Trichonephila clavipes]
MDFDVGGSTFHSVRTGRCTHVTDSNSVNQIRIPCINDEGHIYKKVKRVKELERSCYHIHISACSEQNRTLLVPDDKLGMKSELRHHKEKGILRTRKTCLPNFKPKLSNSNRPLYIWWDIREPIHFELLKPSEKLDSERYCQ